MPPAFGGPQTTQRQAQGGVGGCRGHGARAAQISGMFESLAGQQAPGKETQPASPSAPMVP